MKGLETIFKMVKPFIKSINIAEKIDEFFSMFLKQQSEKYNVSEDGIKIIATMQDGKLILFPYVNGEYKEHISSNDIELMIKKEI